MLVSKVRFELKKTLNNGEKPLFDSKQLGGQETRHEFNLKSESKLET